MLLACLHENFLPARAPWHQQFSRMSTVRPPVLNIRTTWSLRGLLWSPQGLLWSSVSLQAPRRSLCVRDPHCDPRCSLAVRPPCARPHNACEELTPERRAAVRRRRLSLAGGDRGYRSERLSVNTPASLSAVAAQCTRPPAPASACCSHVCNVGKPATRPGALCWQAYRLP